MKRANTRILVFLLFTSVCQCSVHAPEIREYIAQVLYFHDLETERKYQKLSIFIVPEDEDGSEDIHRIYLLNDREELYWSIESDAWQKINDNGKEWIGTSSLVMPEGASFPLGEYRLVLEDLSGEYTEKLLYLFDHDINPKNIDYPELVIKEESLEIKNAYSGNFLWFFLEKNRNAGAVQITGNTIPLAEIKNLVSGRGFDPQLVSFYFYSYWPEKKIGIVTGPYFFR